MKKESEDNFLEKIKTRIDNGEFDDYASLTPLLTKNLIFISVKDKLNRKNKSGGTPILNESEIKTALEDAKETALQSSMLFIKLGFIEKKDGKYELTKLGKLAVKEANMMSVEKFIKN